MTLREVFESVPDAQIGMKCWTCAAVDEMSDDDRVFLEGLLGDRRVSASKIAKALVGAGFKASEGAVARHRRGECMGLR